MTDFNKAQTRVCLLVLGLAALSITLLLSLSLCPSSLSPCIYIPLSARALSSFTLAWTELSRELAAEGESNLEEPFFFPQSPPKAQVRSFASWQSRSLTDYMQFIGVDWSICRPFCVPGEEQSGVAIRKGGRSVGG